MDYELNDDQAALVSAVQTILEDFRELDTALRLQPCHFNLALQQVLQDNGFLDAGRAFGMLEAALIAVEIAKLPAVVEYAVSAMVLPNVAPDQTIDGPVAIVAANRLDKAHRNLTVARHALVDCGDRLLLMAVDADNVEPVESVYGYPFGRFRNLPDLATLPVLSAATAAEFKKWWRLAIATEMTGAAYSALHFTVDYVKERHVFGKPIGVFQAVQHRLAQCHQIVQGMYYLTLKAAWSGTDLDIALASCYCQQHIQKLVFDLHQFNGAMGVTFEHLLHFWTYRLRALQAEAGGVYEAAMAIADQRWAHRTG